MLYPKILQHKYINCFGSNDISWINPALSHIIVLPIKWFSLLAIHRLVQLGLPLHKAIAPYTRLIIPFAAGMLMSGSLINAVPDTTIKAGRFIFRKYCCCIIIDRIHLNQRYRCPPLWKRCIIIAASTPSKSHNFLKPNPVPKLLTRSLLHFLFFPERLCLSTTIPATSYWAAILSSTAFDWAHHRLLDYNSSLLIGIFNGAINSFHSHLHFPPGAPDTALYLGFIQNHFSIFKTAVLLPDHIYILFLLQALFTRSSKLPIG